MPPAGDLRLRDDRQGGGQPGGRGGNLILPSPSGLGKAEQNESEGARSFHPVWGAPPCVPGLGPFPGGRADGDGKIKQRWAVTLKAPSRRRNTGDIQAEGLGPLMEVCD
jgi:hypothetical protein